MAIKERKRIDLFDYRFFCELCETEFNVSWARPSHYEETEYCPFCGSEAFDDEEEN